MNLIEQLGGYERAKHEFEMIKEMKPIYPGEIETNNRLLLEYRRQHNIFEVGDLVVNDAFINSHVYVFKKLLPDISMALIAYDDDEGACGLYSLRHASPEEIKAGKRLEVNS
ncbi:hypothetical protein [Acinetobacter indicus]|uniref:hypothetical protein n=1 Tax=Acinetobacter indicus TaxID=756892 RepID=UPI00209B20BE|nr:hypothetical protein [Acinetobacter indicus]MCO8100878.1 hypothetical protein [Acinetobacter indicus]MCO8106473.1 hypothetical protein [Acinetobacter indicus]MCO8112147.1 hypothetical protein [Acinetobacter indicus]